MSAQEVAAREHVESAKSALALAHYNYENRPPETDGENYEQSIRAAKAQHEDAWEAWIRLANQLHKFDKSVPESKRDSSEKMTRDEITRLFQMIAVYQRTANENMITGICADMPSCRKPEEVYILCADKFRECMSSAIDSAIREEHLPTWVRECFADVL